MKNSWKRLDKFWKREIKSLKVITVVQDMDLV